MFKYNVREGSVKNPTLFEIQTDIPFEVGHFILFGKKSYVIKSIGRELVAGAIDSSKRTVVASCDGTMLAIVESRMVV